MNNPFLGHYNQRDDYYYLDENCSINKVVLAKLPVEGIEDELKGEKAGYILNTKTILNEIKDRSKELNINLDRVSDFDLTKEVADRFMDADEGVRECAFSIARKYGHRLGLILLTLKTGLKENREARPEWTDECWEYWAQLDRVILAGGLTNAIFGEKLKTFAIEVFRMADVEPYDILLFNNSSHLGVMGCATLIKESYKSNLIFDFGQTRIKRSLITVKNKKIVDEVFLQSCDSMHMKYGIKDEEECRQEGMRLHEYVKTVIIDTYNEIKDYSNVGNEIIISIASYIIDGKLNDHRGGYAKLSLVSDDYEKFLSQELKKELKKPIKVKFVHDGTAIALHFKEYRNTVCLSLGTAIGVGFPS